jgi:hypothetical protein
MQIRTRLTVQFSLLVSGILLITFLAIYFFSYYNVTEDFYDRLRSKAKSQAELLLKVQVPLINSEVLKALDETNRDLIYDENIFIFDEKNRLIYSNTTSAVQSACTSPITGWTKSVKPVRSGTMMVIIR